MAENAGVPCREQRAQRRGGTWGTRERERRLEGGHHGSVGMNIYILKVGGYNTTSRPRALFHPNISFDTHVRDPTRSLRAFGYLGSLIARRVACIVNQDRQLSVCAPPIFGFLSPFLWSSPEEGRGGREGGPQNEVSCGSLARVHYSVSVPSTGPGRADPWFHKRPPMKPSDRPQ